MNAWLHGRLASYRRLHPRLISSFVLMSAAVAASLVAVAYAKAIDMVTSAMTAASSAHPWAFLAAAPLWMTLAWALVHYFDRAARGSGIPQVLAAIEVTADTGPVQVLRDAWRNVRLVLVKVASSLSAIAAGGVVGREGPTIQIAAAVFELFDGLFRRYVRRTRSRESLLIAGGAAGLAAAFNTPLGGVVFAIEELGKNHFRTFKGVLILSVVTAGFATQAMLGPYLFVGHVAIGAVTWGDSLAGMGVAAVLGTMGALYGVVLFHLVQLVRPLPAHRRLAIAAGCGLATAAAVLLIGPLAGGGGHLLVREMLFANRHVSWPLAVWRVAGSLVTYLSGCAVGIFAPSLSAGAALGAKAAALIHSDNPNLIAVLGMIAFLTGATRSPFTSFILVFEMTDRQAAVVPMMAAALLANGAAKLVEETSFYEKTRNVMLGRAPHAEEGTEVA